MIRRDMPEVIPIETASFEFPWSEDDFVRCLRQRNCIGMVAEMDDQVVGFMIYELHKTACTSSTSPWPIAIAGWESARRWSPSSWASFPIQRRSRILWKSASPTCRPTFLPREADSGPCRCSRNSTKTRPKTPTTRNTATASDRSDVDPGEHIARLTG